MAVDLGRSLSRQSWDRAEWPTGASHQNRDAFPTAKGPKNREMGGLKFILTEPTAILLERRFHLLLRAILPELRQLWSAQVK